MNLYRKLLLAQAPIAIALALVGIFSVVVVSYLGSHSQTILKDNYRSVLAAQRMKEAIERMDSGALFIVAGERQKGLEQAEKNRPIFEAELKVQEGNITESGEKEFTAGLRDAWTDYQAKFAKLEKSAGADEAKQFYFSELESAFYKVKSAADEILAINQDTMVRKSDEVRRTGGAHERGHDHGGARCPGARGSRFDFFDPALAAAAFGPQRGDTQNRRGSTSTRGRSAGQRRAGAVGAGLQCHGRRAWRNIAKVRWETCCKRI